MTNANLVRQASIESTQLLGEMPLCYAAKNLCDAGVPVFSADELRGNRYAFIWWERTPTTEERAIALPCIAHADGIELNFPPENSSGNIQEKS